MSSNLPLSRIYGTIYGNCIGDAIGLLTEFMTKVEANKSLFIKYYKKKDLEFADKVPDMHRARWKNGDWTDDSDQMILMMLSILENNGKVVASDYGKKIKGWAQNGFPDLGDYGGMGIGATTLYVLRHKQFDENPHAAAEAIWRKTECQAAPNGAVMRTSLMGIYQFEDLEKVTKNTLEFCKVTHADYRCQASCVAVTRALALMLQGKHMKSEKKFKVKDIIEASFEHAKNYIPSDCDHQEEYIEELKFHMYAKSIKDLKLDEYKKIGYTYKTLGAGFWALKQKDFRKALQEIVMEAGDADTNGAVAGALLGCKLGVEHLPKSWLDGLIHKDWLDKIITRFISLDITGMGDGKLAEGDPGSSNVNQDLPSNDTEQQEKSTQQEEPRCLDNTGPITENQEEPSTNNEKQDDISQKMETQDKPGAHSEIQSEASSNTEQHVAEAVDNQEYIPEKQDGPTNSEHQDEISQEVETQDNPAVSFSKDLDKTKSPTEQHKASVVSELEKSSSSACDAESGLPIDPHADVSTASTGKPTETPGDPR